MGQELSSCVACFYEPSMDTIDPESMYHIQISFTPHGMDVNFQGDLSLDQLVNFFLCDSCLKEYMISQGRSLAMNYTFNSTVTVYFHQVQDDSKSHSFAGLKAQFFLINHFLYAKSQVRELGKSTTFTRYVFLLMF